MRNFKDTFYGFIILTITVAFNTTVGILIYNAVKDNGTLATAAIIFVVILASSLIFTVIDYLRRKITVERPLKEILSATKQLARGNFKVKLIPYHMYNKYDEFDYIKDNLNMMAQELSKSEVLKNDFIANVSHEIKTPLSIIQNYAQYLKNPNLSEEERAKNLENLNNACYKLNTLVANILKLNKLENQKLEPNFKKFNLSELLASQVLSFENLIESKKINLICDIKEDLYIVSEESYLEIVINNLMSNAIKFSHLEGEIYVSLKDKDNKYELIFKDNGCGMNSETGAHIFDKFYQGDTSHSKEGNGLGLALVKKVIDILGGTISIDSELGKGTTFKIEIKGV